MTISKVMGVTDFTTVMNVADIANVMGVDNAIGATLLDGFESISGTLSEYTSSGYVWYQTSAAGTGLGITTSTSHVTQGSFSWRWQATSLNVSGPGWQYRTSSDYIVGVDLSGFNSIELDVFGATVPANVAIDFFVEDLPDFNQFQFDGTATGFSGADTLVLDISGFTPTEKANCNIGMRIYNVGPGTSGAVDIYIDYLRGS